MAGVRFFLAGVIMYAIALWQGAPKSSLAEWRAALIIGACLLFCGNGGVTIAEQWVPSGLASLLVATVPIYIALLAWLTRAAPRPRPLVLLGTRRWIYRRRYSGRPGPLRTASRRIAARRLRDANPSFRIASLVDRDRFIHAGRATTLRPFFPPPKRCSAAEGS
jgi:hypothetical protein